MTLAIRPADVVSRTRIFPARSGERVSTPLSILDATVARFTPASATWLFDAPHAPSVDILHRSLVATLDAYPQLAGQLHWGPRCGRPTLTYGSTTGDPGVEFVQAESSHVLVDIVPDPASRCAGPWDASCVPKLGLLPDEPKFALHDLKTFEGLPCTVVQITTFKCGSVGVAVKIAHPIADAQALVTFVRDWAATSRALAQGHALPVLNPMFDPSRLDAAAVPGTTSALSLHRYDWWATPSGDIDAARVPSELQAAGVKIESSGKCLPWVEWDLSAPVSHVLVHFSPAEIQRIYLAASTESIKISRLDALLAHVWSCIIRARQLDAHVEEVYLDVTLGMRSRVDPPLPDNFMGSPILLTHASASPSTLTTTSAASSIREVMSRFTPPAVAALLHEWNQVQCPHRYWDAFLGARHTLVTSWLRLGVYEIDFVGDGRPVRYVDALMPDVDGCLCIMEGEKATGRQWYDDSVCVSLHLKADVMLRVLVDPLLRV
ncbi:hypothetical protein EXIGLDRAFT_716574 [Exidia glandulosa HHB12029]|uniref:Transferase family protein n=1 Tax=Exidia glandulosa HHB12029 TaxID=1314781 RepID=A0A165IVU0_EXIGL|nr:hypothetical protein EXIGLDRAFT_716574 [Exidia glandulosa HHB12029]